jgi:hypothetical protein
MDRCWVFIEFDSLVDMLGSSSLSSRGNEILSLLLALLLDHIHTGMQGTRSSYSVPASQSDP